MENYKKHKDKIKGFEDNFYKKKVAIFKKALPICIILEDNVPILYILDELLDCLVIDAKTNDTKDNPIRRMNLQISKNLFRFMKGLHFVPSKEFNGDFYQFVMTEHEYSCAENRSFFMKVETEKEEIEITYRIFRGEQLNIMELSDYIGLAITTPDFLLKSRFTHNFIMISREIYSEKTEDDMYLSLNHVLSTQSLMTQKNGNSKRKTLTN